MKKRKKKILAALSLVAVVSTTVLPSATVFAHNIPIRQFATNLEEIRVEYPNLYEQLIALKRKYPNWNFQIYNTNWDWNQFINFQTEVPSRALIESWNFTRRGANWVDPNYRNQSYDTDTDRGRWKKASRAAVEYFVDPRTYLNERDIFAFLNTDPNYAPKMDIESQKANVRKILTGTKFEKYVDVVVKVCMEENAVSSTIAALLKQENGPEINPLNVGMSGNGTGNVLESGMNYAKSRGWNNFESGLRGGVKLVARGYGASGQNTKHSIKFNYVTNKPSLQYMQNIEAPMTEGMMVRNGVLASDPYLNKFTYNFLIPIFHNMPNEACKSPDLLQSMKVEELKPGESRAEVSTPYGLRFRTEPTTRYNNVQGVFPKGTIFIIEEEVTNHEKLDTSYVWYKVRTLEGRNYYIAAGLKAYDERWINILEVSKKEEKPKVNEPKEEPKVELEEEKIPEIKYSERNYYGKVNAKVTVNSNTILKFRSLPSTTYSVIYSELPRDKEIYVLSKVTPEIPNGELWYKVEVNGKVGFVSKGQPGNEVYFEFLDKDFIFEDEYINLKEEKEQAKKKKQEELKEKQRLEKLAKEKQEAERKRLEEEKKKAEEEKAKLEAQKKLEEEAKSKNVEIKKGKFKAPVEIEITINSGVYLRNKPGLFADTKIIQGVSKGTKLKVSESIGVIDHDGQKYLWFKLDSEDKYISKGVLGETEYFKFLSEYELIEPPKKQDKEEQIEEEKTKNEDTNKENKEKEQKQEEVKEPEKERDILGNNKNFHELEYKNKKLLSVIYNFSKEAIKELGNFEIKTKNGQIINSSEVELKDFATGSKIIINGTEYTIIRKGDVNGDGIIDKYDAEKVMNIRKGAKVSSIEKAAARLSVEETYEESINAPINIQNTKDFKILLKDILKK